MLGSCQTAPQWQPFLQTESIKKWPANDLEKWQNTEWGKGYYRIKNLPCNKENCCYFYKKKLLEDEGKDMWIVISSFSLWGLWHGKSIQIKMTSFEWELNWILDLNDKLSFILFFSNQCYLFGVVIAGMVKTLHVVNGTMWHNTFLGLWVAALRLVQRVGIILTEKVWSCMNSPGNIAWWIYLCMIINKERLYYKSFTFYFVLSHGTFTFNWLTGSLKNV